MDWSILLNYALGILFFIALFFAIRFEEKAHQAENRANQVIRELQIAEQRLSYARSKISQTKR